MSLREQLDGEHAQPSGLPQRSSISHQYSLVCGGALTFQSLERRSSLSLLVTLGRADWSKGEVREGRRVLGERRESRSEEAPASVRSERLSNDEEGGELGRMGLTSTCELAVGGWREEEADEVSESDPEQRGQSLCSLAQYVPSTPVSQERELGDPSRPRGEDEQHGISRVPPLSGSTHCPRLSTLAQLGCCCTFSTQKAYPLLERWQLNPCGPACEGGQRRGHQRDSLPSPPARTFRRRI